jgi:hypothetical protein
MIRSRVNATVAITRAIVVDLKYRAFQYPKQSERPSNGRGWPVSAGLPKSNATVAITRTIVIGLCVQCLPMSFSGVP